jgi:L-type amino acid transporter 9
LEHAETGGYAMVLWVLSGMVATMGALCYAEVGILVPKSGGEYPIIYDAYGGIPGFLFAWERILNSKCMKSLF